jgi:hypothetical protein
MTVVPTSAPPTTTTSVLGAIVGDKYIYIGSSTRPLTDYLVKHSPYFQAGFGLMVTKSMPILPSTALTPSIDARTHVSVATQCRASASA